MRTKPDLADIPIPVDASPGTVQALQQLQTNMRNLGNFLNRDFVTFTSTGGQENLSHKLGEKPTHFRVVATEDATTTLYATKANKDQWTKSSIVLTSSASGNIFTIEVI